MNKLDLEKIKETIMVRGKGILAIDESNSTAGLRLASIGLENTEENRRRYRDLFLDVPEIEKYISGAILYDETIRQNSLKEIPFIKLLEDKSIVSIIKVDMGIIDMEGFPGEKITEGLLGLEDRLKEYYEMGARGAKWRAIIQIGENMPSDECISQNAEILSKYAHLCQEAGIVPLVEPEVLMDGTHTIETSEEVLGRVLKKVFDVLQEKDVYLPGLILKTSMVISGKDSNEIKTEEEIAERTVRVLNKYVPKNVGGVVFLSGGQSTKEGIANLNAIAEDTSLPWDVSFSYGRAIQGPALNIWSGNDDNLTLAKEAYLTVLKDLSKATEGEL